MPTTPLGIQYPASTETHPSAAWWQALATTTDAAIRGHLEENLNTLPTLSNVNLDAFTSTFGGTGRWSAAASDGITGFPPELTGGRALFEQYRNSTTSGVQWWTTVSGTRYKRSHVSGVWSAWTVDGEWSKSVIAAGTDLDAWTTPGGHRATASQPLVNAPWPGEVSYTLEVLPMGTSWNLQRATNEAGDARVRVGTGSSGTNWSSWRDMGGGGSGTVDSTGGESRTQMEVAGTWTSIASEDTYVDSLGLHQAATVVALGTSVQGRPIRALRFGDPTKPTLLIMATQHGNEPGPREGALIFARELAQATTFALFDICVVVVPTVNPDGVVTTSRDNANGANINRDWAAGQVVQPETQAIVNGVFGQYDVVAAVDSHSFGYAREVSIRETRNSAASVETRARSQALYDAVFAAISDDGHDVRMYGEPGDPTTPETFVHEVSATHRVAPLLLEVPCHRNTYGEYSPTPFWQAHMASIVFHRVLDLVWRDRDLFIAAKSA